MTASLILTSADLLDHPARAVAAARAALPGQKVMVRLATGFAFNKGASGALLCLDYVADACVRAGAELQLFWGAELSTSMMAQSLARLLPKAMMLSLETSLGEEDHALTLMWTRGLASSQCRLRHLDITECAGIESSTVSVLAAALRRNKSLISISVTDLNELNPEYYAALDEVAEALAENPYIENVTLFPMRSRQLCTLARCKTLRSVCYTRKDFFYNDDGEDANVAGALAELLESCPRLKYVQVLYANDATGSVERLRDAVAAAPSLEVMSIISILEDTDNVVLRAVREGSAKRAKPIDILDKLDDEIFFLAQSEPEAEASDEPLPNIVDAAYNKEYVVCAMGDGRVKLVWSAFEVLSLENEQRQMLDEVHATKGPLVVEQLLGTRCKTMIAPAVHLLAPLHRVQHWALPGARPTADDLQAMLGMRTLRVLDLQDAKLVLPTCQALSAALGESSCSLERLCLRRVRTDELAPVIKAAACLTELCLSAIEAKDAAECLDAVVALMAASASLAALDLSGFELGNGGLERVAGALATSKVQWFDLSFCHATSSAPMFSAKAASKLASGAQRLRHLAVWGGALPDGGEALTVAGACVDLRRDVDQFEAWPLAVASKEQCACAEQCGGVAFGRDERGVEPRSWFHARCEMLAFLQAALPRNKGSAAHAFLTRHRTREVHQRVFAFLW